MRLCAVSTFTSSQPRVILDFLERTTADFVLLPGSGSNTPTPTQVQRVLQSGVSVFVEGAGGKRHAIPYLVTSTSTEAMPRQIFSQHPTANEIDVLVQNLPDRTFTIATRKVTILICGEIIAFNPDGTVKHGRTLPFDILANPAHTMMGHWNHLGRKLVNLSLKSLVLYCTNNDHGHNRLTTDVRIYQKGILLLNRNSDGDLT
jgi:hypothetical protein